jgi:hypothetical protein
MRAIVFVLRGCPAGWLGTYGNEWVGSPNLDRIAAEGVVFDRHLSDCPIADEVCWSWRNGRHHLPPLPDQESLRVAEDAVGCDILLSPLRAAGVWMVLIRANHPDTDAPAPFYAGWDEVFDARPQADQDSPLDALLGALPSLLDRLATVPRWLAWVEIDRLLPPWDVRQDVFEAYLGDEDEVEPIAPNHDRLDDSQADPDSDGGGEEFGENGGDESDNTNSEGPAEDTEELDPREIAAPAEAESEPVSPFFDPPTGPFDRADPAAWEWLHRTFAAVVTSLDAELGAIFDQLQTRGLDQTATWVVTSDHGYPLGEHGQVGIHRPWLHEELVHVPLIVRFPGAAEAGRRVPSLTQPVDLAPTLLELFGAELPTTSIHGHSLLPLVRGEVEAVRPYALSGLTQNGATEWAIRTAEWAYLLPGPRPDTDPPRQPQLFEKPDDRWEVNDLQRQHLDLAERLDAVLRQAIVATWQPGSLVLPEVEVANPESIG